MRENPLDERLLRFAGQVLRLTDEIYRNPTQRFIAMQLSRSCSSIGANYEEAAAAESDADFTHKMQVALKEARETRYWIRLLADSKIIPSTRLAPLVQESLEIRAMLTSVVMKMKRRLGTLA